jgi:hypothetical protein
MPDHTIQLFTKTATQNFELTNWTFCPKPFADHAIAQKVEFGLGEQEGETPPFEISR